MCVYLLFAQLGGRSSCTSTPQTKSKVFLKNIGQIVVTYYIDRADGVYPEDFADGK